MGIYNPWAEMPESCIVCDYREKCQLSNQNIFGLSSYKSNHCPLVEVKSPHGRLIDADALMAKFDLAERMMEQYGQEYSCSFMSSGNEISTEWHCVEDMLENEKTVIESEADNG